MEDRETARMRKYGESKTTRIMMATVPHVTFGLGLRKFQADGFLLTRVYTVTVTHKLHKFNKRHLKTFDFGEVAGFNRVIIILSDWPEHQIRL